MLCSITRIFPLCINSIYFDVTDNTFVYHLLVYYIFDTVTLACLYFFKVF